MSTSTSDKPAADPYREKNIDNVSLKEKIEDLSEFISKCKFGMMTTHHGQTGALVSRCMGLAAKVRPFPSLLYPSPPKKENLHEPKPTTHRKTTAWT
jgi:hypothetical protein